MTRLQRRGLEFTLAGPLLVLATWLGTKAWLLRVAESRSNPDQNAMVLGLLLNVASLIVGAGLLGYGLECFRRDYRNRK
jgi:hypothetical protein